MSSVMKTTYGAESAQDDVNIKKCIEEIIKKDIYKKDYENITVPLIFDK